LTDAVTSPVTYEQRCHAHRHADRQTDRETAENTNTGGHRRRHVSSRLCVAVA